MSIKRCKIFFLILFTAMIGTGQVIGNQPGLVYKGEELCCFAGDLVGLLNEQDQEGLMAALRSFKREASPEMQPVIKDLIQVLETKGINDFVSDLGRRIKMDTENRDHRKPSVYREDLISITSKLDKKFSVENDDYHRAMVHASADKNYAKMLYSYLKISEDRSFNRNATSGEADPSQAK
ncbi:MAG: hypothetical protein AAF443_06940 [Chlamydiota bacterium]